MMMFDPLYMAVLVVGFALSGLASLWTKGAFRKYSRVSVGRGVTGAQVAAAILRAEGISDVRIERTSGFLSDHYDPRAKVLRLSPDVHDGASVSAAGVAAHEVGHALQDAQGYLPMRLRQAMVPVANLGTSLGLWIAVIGLVIGATGLATVGVVLFGAFVAFTVVTLPVELDASWRARKTLEQHGLLRGPELRGVTRVLTAAAATYLAAAISAVLQLLYWLARLGLLGGRDD